VRYDLWPHPRPFSIEWRRVPCKIESLLELVKVKSAILDVEFLNLDLGEVGFDKINHIIEYTRVMIYGLIPGPSQ
jgi:hypothetical protein